MLNLRQTLLAQNVQIARILNKPLKFAVIKEILRVEDANVSKLKQD